MSLEKKMLGVLTGAVALAVTFGVAERAQAQARNNTYSLYVATNGTYNVPLANAVNNSNNPYDTIQHACQAAAADSTKKDYTIIVKAGTYTNSAIVSGNSYLTIRPETVGTVTLKATAAANNYAVVKIDGSHDILFQSFNVDGTGGGSECNGVIITPRLNGSVVTRSYNIQVKYCTVHDANGAGIASNAYNEAGDYGCDRIEITGNEIYNCLTLSGSRGSGISLHFNHDYEVDNNGNKLTTDFHSKIQNNNIHDNINQYPGSGPNGNAHSDGNGIIIDTCDNSGKFNGPKTLIQNNLVYRNGGRGIHVFLSSNVSVLNNTVYGNDLDPQLQGGGELTVVTADNVKFSNNIVQGNGIKPAFVVGKVYGTTNGTISFKNNTYGGAGTNAAGYIDWPSTIYFNPATTIIFKGASSTANTASDFTLKSLGAGNEVALNKGSSVLGDYSSNAIDGTPRPVGGAVDRGAYEQ